MPATFTPYTRNWKFFEDDGAEPTAQLANENVKPDLTDNSIIRLRVNVCEEGGANGTNAAWSLQYDTDSGFSDPQNFGAAPQHWNYADGQATEGNTISGLKLTDTADLGLYYESGSVLNLLAKNDDEESDFAIQPTASVSPTTTYYFRVLIGGTPIPLGGGETYPQVTTSAGAANDYFWPPEGDNEGGGSIGAFVAAAIIAFTPMPQADIPAWFSASADYGKPVVIQGNVSASLVADGDAFHWSDWPSYFEFSTGYPPLVTLSGEGDRIGAANQVSDVYASLDIGDETYTADVTPPGTAYVPDTTGGYGYLDGGSDRYGDIVPVAGVSGEFSGSSDFLGSYKYESVTTGVFGVDHEIQLGFGYAPDVGSSVLFAAGHEVEFGLGYAPDIGATGLFAADHAKVLGFTPESTTAGSFSTGAGVTAVVAGGADYVPELQGAVSLFEISTDYALFSDWAVAFEFTTGYPPLVTIGVGEQTQRGGIAFVGSVPASLAAGHDVYTNFAPDAASYGVFEAGADYTYTSAGTAYTETGDVYGEFSADHVFSRGVAPDVAATGLFAASVDSGYGVSPPVGIPGQFDVGEGTYTATIRDAVAYSYTSDVATQFVVSTDFGRWSEWSTEWEFATGYPPVVLVAVDEDKPLVSYAVDSGYGPAWKVIHPAEYWLSTVREPAPTVIGFVSAAVITPNIYVDATHEGLASVVFRSGADVTSTGTQTVTYSGDVSGTFAASKDVGIGYASDVTGTFSAGADVVAKAATSYAPEVGVSAKFSSDYNAYLQIADAVETGTVSWGLSGGVSTVTIEFDSVGAYVPYGSFSVGADYVKSPVQVSEQLTGSVAEFFGLGDDTYTAQVGTIRVDGSVYGSFSANADTNISPAIAVVVALSAGADVNISPAVAVSGSFSVASIYGKNVITPVVAEGGQASITAASDVSVSRLFTEPAVFTKVVAGADIERSVTAISTATLDGNVVGGWALSHTSVNHRQPVPLAAVVFTPAGTDVYAYVAPPVVGPYDTTWSCEGVPGDGASQYGVWTETTEDGGWTENVGWAMSQGGERGGYTQDGAPTLDIKPNVFDTTVPPAYRYYGYGFLADIDTYGFHTEPDWYGFYTDSIIADELFVDTDYSCESVPTTSFTTEKKLVGG